MKLITILCCLGILTGYVLPMENTRNKKENQSAEPPQDIFVYSHGLNSNQLKALAYAKAGVLPITNLLAVTYEDAQWNIGTVSLYSGNSSVGQKGDIERLGQFLEMNNATYPNRRVVSFCESRGSVTAINYLGTAPRRKIRHIKALVLDSPFDHIRNALPHFLKSYCLNHLFSVDTAEKIFAKIYGKYDPKGLQPSDTIESIPNIPVLIICSQEDSMIPITCSIALYEKLRARGRTNVHILIVPRGKHGYIMIGKCKDLYKRVVHAFYKTYGIWHDPALAQAGMDYFSTNCQPAIGAFDED